MTEKYYFVHINCSMFINSSAKGHRGFLENLALVDLAAINLGVHVFYHFPVSVSLG